LSGSVVSSEIIAYEDLGPEAVVRLQVRAMPLFVINDIYGNDLYETGMERYQK
jgi:fumarate hydratase subunit beta